jgi:SAM-dependent methyltransferase
VKRGGGWWVEAFGRPYLEVYAHRDEVTAEREAAFVATLLHLRADERVLDAGCGAGRHVRALARRGAEPVGVDLSEELLREARQAGAERYVRGDLRALPFADASFRHVVSFFTSFGYFDEDGNRTQLMEMRRVLARGGRLVVDFLNPPRVTGTLEPETVRRVGLYDIREKRWIRGGRVEKEVSLVDTASGTTHSWTESVCLYERKDLETLLAGAGFAVESVHGDLAGAPWGVDAERLVVAAAAV